MAYRYILRKYMLPEGFETSYQAREAWAEMKRTRKPEELQGLVIDEFPVTDQPKQLGWFRSLLKQIFG